MATPLPDGVQSTLVTGRFMQIVVDNHDPDTKPEGVPLANLKISIVPSVEGRIIRNTAAGVSMVIEGFVATTDDAGYLGIRPPGAPAFQRGMEIPASDSSGITPKGWTYRVTIDETTGQRRRLAQFDIVAEANVPIDLTTVIPVPPNPGEAVREWEQAVQVAEDLIATIPAEVEAEISSQMGGVLTRVTTVENQVAQISRTNSSMGEGAPTGSAPIGWWYTDVLTGDVWRNE